MDYRLAYLDMPDSTVNCPTGFRLYETGACGIDQSVVVLVVHLLLNIHLMVSLTLKYE